MMSSAFLLLFVSFLVEKKNLLKIILLSNII